jgi:hypothetical protein
MMSEFNILRFAELIARSRGHVITPASARIRSPTYYYFLLESCSFVNSKEEGYIST